MAIFGRVVDWAAPEVLSNKSIAIDFQWRPWDILGMLYRTPMGPVI
jgi:hypothetical protein